MRRNLSIFFLGIAWFCANGATSHTAQLFAWSQLVVAFAHHLPADQALIKKYGDHDRCPICMAVEQARKDARNHPVPTENPDLAKLPLLCERAPVAILISEQATFSAPSKLSAPVRFEPVQTGPPRSLT